MPELAQKFKTILKHKLILKLQNGLFSLFQLRGHLDFLYFPQLK